MDLVLTLYSSLYLISAVVSAAVFVAAYRRRRTAGGMMLTLMMAAAFEWSLCGSFEMASVGVADKIRWSQLEYFGAVTVPVFFFLFSLQYSWYERWVKPRRALWFFLIPLATVILAATNDAHHLIWTGFTPGPPGLNVLIYGHGVWWWFGLMGYSYLMMMGGTLFLMRSTIQFHRAYRRQTLGLLAATLIPWLASFIYATGMSPLPGLDFTRVAFTLSGGILFFALHEWGLMDLTPVARNILIETMPDGILVLDLQHRVIDCNPAALAFLKLPATIIGKQVDQYLTDRSDLLACFDRSDPKKYEVQLSAEPLSCLEFTGVPIVGQGGRVFGLLVLLRDVTERKRAESVLDRAARTDMLTGLWNRREFRRRFDEEESRFRRNAKPFSIVIADIDFFKRVNDTYGHDYGDYALQTVAALIRDSLRKQDVVTRWGGEEFAFLLPETTLEQAVRVAEKVRRAIAAYRFIHQDLTISITISLGVTVYRPDMMYDDVVKEADQCLYKAKEAGRDRVVSIEGATAVS